MKTHLIVNWRNRFLQSAPALILGALFSVSILFVIRLLKSVDKDFDSHHDGFILSTAIALGEGRIPYRDYFDQYGPLPNIINAAVIKLLPWLSPSVAIRWIGFGALLISAGFLLALSKKSEMLIIPVSACCLTLALHDVNYGVVFLPWNNLILNAILVMLIALIHLSRVRRASFYFVGVLAALVRPQFAVVLVLFPLFMSYPKYKRQTASLLAVIGAAVVSIFGLLKILNFNALSILQESFISFPKRTYGPMLFRWFDWLEGALKSNFLVAVAGGIAGLIVGLNCVLADRAFKSLKFYLIPLMGLFAVAHIVQVPRPVSSNLWVASQVEINRWSPFVLETLTFYLGAFLVGIAAGSLYVLIFLRQRAPTRVKTVLVISLIGVLGMSQAVPVPDSRHIWYAFFAGVSAVVAILCQWTLSRGFLVTIGILTLISSFALFSSTKQSYSEYVSINREESVSSPLIRGMKNPSNWDKEHWHSQVISSIEEDLLLLARNFGDKEKGIFLVSDASYAVFDGSWRSVSRNQVIWGSKTPIVDELAEFKYPVVIIQKGMNDIDTSAIVATLRENQYLLSAEGEKIQIFRRFP